jgi:hypothetical protein
VNVQLVDCGFSVGHEEVSDIENRPAYCRLSVQNLFHLLIVSTGSISSRRAKIFGF